MAALVCASLVTLVRKLLSELKSAVVGPIVREREVGTLALSAVCKSVCALSVPVIPPHATEPLTVHDLFALRSKAVPLMVRVRLGGTQSVETSVSLVMSPKFVANTFTTVNSRINKLLMLKVSPVLSGR